MEDLAYRRLLDVYYMREEALPADIQATAKLVRMRSMAADVECVLHEFFTLTDAGWTHKRCDAEIAKMQDKQAKARASGIASANVRRTFAERASKAKSTDVEKQPTDVEQPLGKLPTDVQLPTPTPTPILKEGEEDAQAPIRPSIAGAVCMAMKAEGMATVNPSHPELLVLIGKGADIGLFASVARDCVAAKKPFSYALAVVRGQMADAAALAGTALATPGAPAEKFNIGRITVPINPNAGAELDRLRAEADMPRNGPDLATLERMAKLRQRAAA